MFFSSETHSFSNTRQQDTARWWWTFLVLAQEWVKLWYFINIMWAGDNTPKTLKTDGFLSCPESMVWYFFQQMLLWPFHVFHCFSPEMWVSYDDILVFGITPQQTEKTIWKIRKVEVDHFRPKPMDFPRFGMFWYESPGPALGAGLNAWNRERSHGKSLRVAVGSGSMGPMVSLGRGPQWTTEHRQLSGWMMTPPPRHHQHGNNGIHAVDSRRWNRQDAGNSTFFKFCEKNDVLTGEASERSHTWGTFPV